MDTIETLAILITFLFTAIATYLVTRKLDSAKFDIYVEQAKAKAKAIEHEAQLVLENAKSRLKDQELQLKEQNDEEYKRLKTDYQRKVDLLHKKEQQLLETLEEDRKEISAEKSEVKSRRTQVDRELGEIGELKTHYRDKLENFTKVMENAGGLTREEAKQELLKEIEEQSRLEIANIIRRYENEAKMEARRKANYIIAQATTRFAGDFASERLINTVQLSSDEFKGRIIGKEGKSPANRVVA